MMEKTADTYFYLKGREFAIHCQVSLKQRKINDFEMFPYVVSV